MDFFKHFFYFIFQLGFSIAVIIFPTNIKSEIYYAQDLYTEQQVKNFIEYLKLINRPTLIDTAASHGSLGINVAFATSALNINSADSFTFKMLYSDPNKEVTDSQNIFIPKIYFIKGIYLPVDFGFSIGKANNVDLLQWAYYIQWTFFEDFLMPAFALRYSHSFLKGLEQNNLQQNTDALDFMISYGFFYVSFYTGYGITKNDITFNVKNTYQYSLRLNDSDLKINHSYLNYSAIYGIKISLALNFETALEVQTYNQKLFNTGLKFNIQL